MENTVYLVTKNKGKLLAAKSVFTEFNLELKQLNKSYPEIQAETSSEIARFTALQAAKDIGAPVIRKITACL